MLSFIMANSLTVEAKSAVTGWFYHELIKQTYKTLPRKF